MATITIRMDDQLKKKAELMFEDMGLNMTTAFTIFTKAVVRQRKIPFEITADLFLSDKIWSAFAGPRAIWMLERALSTIYRLMRKLWHDKAWEDYHYRLTQDKRTLKRINQLVTDVDRNGYDGIEKPEPLGGFKRLVVAAHQCKEPPRLPLPRGGSRNPAIPGTWRVTMKRCDASCFDLIKRGLEEAIAYERGELDANITRVTVPMYEWQGEGEYNGTVNPYNKRETH